MTLETIQHQLALSFGAPITDSAIASFSEIFQDKFTKKATNLVQNESLPPDYPKLKVDFDWGYFTISNSRADIFVVQSFGDFISLFDEFLNILIHNNVLIQWRAYVKICFTQLINEKTLLKNIKGINIEEDYIEMELRINKIIDLDGEKYNNHQHFGGGDLAQNNEMRHGIIIELDINNRKLSNNIDRHNISAKLVSFIKNASAEMEKLFLNIND